MNTCKRVHHRGAVGTVLGTVQRKYRDRPRGTLSTDTVLAQVSDRPSFRAANAGSAASPDQSAPVTLPANSPQSLGLLKTKSGLDITQRVTELLWLASERNHLTLEMVHEAFSGDNLTPDDMATVCRTLGQAGVDLASAVESVQSAAHTAAEESVRLKTQGASVQNCVQQTEQAQLLPRHAEIGLSSRMEDADHEMRQILYSFGFAAHEHITRAEKFLAHPSEESFEHLVADSEIRNRIQYLRILPNLVKQVRAMDQKSATAYREWRQALGQPNGEEHRTEFKRLDRELHQTFPRFCYQAKVIQEMTAIAQSIAAKFQASQRLLQQARRSGDSVCQMPLVDVERQTIETMEEFVRMPCEVFLRNCTELNAAGTRFQQARCELIQGHLHLVASIAGTYSNRGLTLPELIRQGIVGLIRAVERFGYRHQWRFSTYAACWIRQSIRGALADQARHGSKPAPPGAGDRDASAKRPETHHPERHQNEL